jgi:hypothetical protein
VPVYSILILRVAACPSYRGKESCSSARSLPLLSKSKRMLRVPKRRSCPCLRLPASPRLFIRSMSPRIVQPPTISCVLIEDVFLDVSIVYAEKLGSPQDTRQPSLLHLHDQDVICHSFAVRMRSTSWRGTGRCPFRPLASCSFGARSGPPEGTDERHTRWVRRCQVANLARRRVLGKGRQAWNAVLVYL